MKKYKRIQIEEREGIMKEVVEGKSLREISSKINRNISSINKQKNKEK